MFFCTMAEKAASITILAVLYGIAGLINILAAPIYWMAAGLGILGKGISIIAIISGILYLFVAWGMWTMKTWVKSRGILPPIIGLLVFPFGTIISIILLILWLVFRREITSSAPYEGL